MYRGHTAGVVIPAYNEEQFVADTIASVPEYVDRVYVIDDGSQDGTWAEIRRQADAENARRDPTAGFDEVVVPIQHTANRGVGGAIKTGYLRARDDRVDVTAVMGGDGQMEPEMLGELFDPLVDGVADYTKGNRFLGRTDPGDMPTFRFIGNSILSALTKAASGYWGSGDPQSGYTAISLRALDETNIEDMYEFYGYCNDILTKLNIAGMRVADVPRPITYGEEESHISYRTYIPRVSKMLFRNFRKRLWTQYVLFDFHPLVASYAAGTGALALGVLGFVWALPGVGSATTPAFRGLLSVLVFLVGIAALVQATTLDRAVNAHLDATPQRDTERPTADRPTERASTADTSVSENGRRETVARIGMPGIAAANAERTERDGEGSAGE